MIVLEKKVFPILDNGGTVVLPTEESARAMAKAYVKSRGKGLLSSRCLSFDNFASLFITHSGMRAADDIDRILFSEGFAEKHAESLSYFYSSSHPEIKNSLSSFINRMIPSINEAFSREIKNRELLYDLQIIMESYRIFLEENGLYEPGWAEYQDRELDRDYYLYNSGAFPKEIKLLDAVSSNPRIHIIKGDKEECELTVYKNEAQEIRALFQNIRALIDRDVPMNSIAVSTSALERLRPYLELESKLFSVPLYFVPGLKAISTPPGRFLKALGEVYQKDYEINQMKKLFLDPAFPFRNKEEAYSFITGAVALSVKNAPKGREDRYKKIGSDFYDSFRRSLDSLMTETDPSKVLFRYERLMEVLFGSERFINSEINDKVYGYTADYLSRFISRAQSLNADTGKPLFPIFLSFLDSIVYVDREKKRGVSVYPFTQAAATPYDYHFLITLNENESAARIREASFLTEYEREDFTETEITEALIASYQGVTGKLFYSASEDTYTGYALPLVALMDNVKRTDAIPSDPYQREASESRAEYIYPLQRVGFDMAKHSTMRRYSKSQEIKGLEQENPRLSFSKITEYIKCPYSYALKYCYGLNSEQPYEIVLFDNLEIGTRLHSVIERFFSSGEKDPKRIESYFQEEMEAWRNGKRYGKDGVLRPMEFGSASATEELVVYLKANFLASLISVAGRIMESTDALENGNEIRFSSESDDGYSLTGIADMVASDKAGNGIVIYDFKKGKAFSKSELSEKSLQFSIYRMLMEKSERFASESVLKGVFVTLTDAKLTEAWNRETAGSEENIANEEDMLKRIADALHRGIWSMRTESKECGKCSFRGLCRRKFAIQ